MKFYYIANARMPTEKAHGIQIAKMCEAFIETGVDLTLVIPRRETDPRSLKEYYGLRVDIPLVRLPAIDWYMGGRFGYLISSVSFMFSYLFFLWRKKMTVRHFVLYTVDTDNYSSSALALLGMPLFSEMHGAKMRTPAQRLLFRTASGIIAINKIITGELQKNFPRSPARYLVESNGVDLSVFTGIRKDEARTRLGLPPHVPMILYAGRFFAWKGLEIVPQAAVDTPLIRWQMVGGDHALFAGLVNMPLPGNLFFAGSRPFAEMPLWLAAADALLVLGTARDVQSYRYTSPMKLFEYLAAGRPIIASGTPAIREVVSDQEVLFYTPDDVHDLARVAAYAVSNPVDLVSRTEAATRHAASASWRARAERIVHFIEEHGKEHIHDER